MSSIGSEQSNPCKRTDQKTKKPRALWISEVLQMKNWALTQTMEKSTKRQNKTVRFRMNKLTLNTKINGKSQTCKEGNLPDGSETLPNRTQQ